MRSLLALAALAVLFGCSLDDETKEIRQDGISIRYPGSWHVAFLSTTNSPRRLAVASFELPDDAVEGDCGGQRAVEALPADGALVIVIDYGVSPEPFPQRPAGLTLDDGVFAEYECLGPSTMFRFRAGDRDLQAHVALGAEASGATQDRALAIVASLEVGG